MPQTPHTSEEVRPAEGGPRLPPGRCPTCHRPRRICVCEQVRVLDCARPILLLQHPQEVDVVLGTAQLLKAALPGCRVRTGLSWPNLAAAWGEPASGRWAVLWNHQLPDGIDTPSAGQPCALIDRTGALLPPASLTGIIALDGSWSQARTLWWRNAWLLRLDRLVLNPTEPGIYGKLRREPNRASVSTLEAVADALAFAGEPPELRSELRRWMRTMVQRARDSDPHRERARQRPGGP